MIIKRKHNTNFTVVPNQPLNDTALSVGAVGLLVYLLSHPDNWNVRIEQLRSRFSVGKDKIYSLVNCLIEAGYIVKQTIRDPETKSFVSHEYIVYDEPLPENPEMGTDEPLPENPHPAKPLPANPTHNKDLKVIRTESNKAPSDEAAKSETGSPSKPKKRISYTPEFDVFWKGYPTTPNMPKAEAFKEWQRLDAADQAAATDSLPAYRKHLAKEDWLKAVYAEGYLKQRRFDGYADSADDIDWARCCNVAIQSGQWSSAFGPPPGHAGCKVPPELITDRLVAAVQGRRASA